MCQFCLLRMMESYCGCFSLPFSSLTENPFTAPPMVCCFQRGLRVLTEAFCRPPATKRGKGQVLSRNGSCPSKDALYILGVVVHVALSHHHSTERRTARGRLFCASLPIQEISVVVRAQKLICRYNAYSFFQCFPSIPGAGYGEEFHDVRGGRSSLGQGIFK